MNHRNQQQQIGWGDWVQSVAVSRVWKSLLSAFEQIIDLWRRSRAASGPSVKLFQVFSRAELASNFSSFFFLFWSQYRQQFVLHLEPLKGGDVEVKVAQMGSAPCCITPNWTFDMWWLRFFLSRVLRHVRKTKTLWCGSRTHCRSPVRILSSSVIFFFPPSLSQTKVEGIIYPLI